MSYLSTPAEANDGPFFDTLALAQFVNNLGDAGQCLWRCGLCLKELAKLLLLVLVVRGVPGDVGWLAFEEVWHENLVLLLLVRVS